MKENKILTAAKNGKEFEGDNFNKDGNFMSHIIKCHLHKDLKWYLVILVFLFPEFFSDTPVINGAAYSYLKVEPKRYRFDILNGSYNRQYNLQLYYARANGSGKLSGEAEKMWEENH